MRQAAHYDLHTTEGLAQVQHLRFVLPSGEVDTQFNGMTIRGGVLDDGIREIPGSEIIDGPCSFPGSRLAAIVMMSLSPATGQTSPFWLVSFMWLPASLPWTWMTTPLRTISTS